MLSWVASHTGLVIFAMFMGFAALEAARVGLRSVHGTREDAPLELTITLLLAGVLLPGVLAFVQMIGDSFAPEARGLLAGWPAWAMVVLLLLGDDLTQYWWHRISHTPLLWPLHRAHHSAPHMGVRVVYRNNFFYYALMPGLWIGAALVYLGLGAVYPWYLLAKALVLMGSHSELRWDAPLYRIRWLHPLAWLLEHTISTPATHFAHHAMHQDDGVGHYKGNFGNMLFVWDLVFGTAHISRRYPPRVGLRDDVDHGPERWWVQLLYPLVKSRRRASVLGPRRVKAERATAPGW